MPNELYRDYIDGKADEIINSLGGTITPAPANAELYRDFLDRKFDDVINGLINVLPIGSASGNPATFNTSLALPLVACKTSFMCTEIGSGTKSPTNPYTLVGVDDITITVNGNGIVIDLAGTRYGGYVDAVKNKLVITNVLYEPTINDTITGQLRNTYNCWCFTINSAGTIYKRDGHAISNINTVKRYANTDNSGFCTIGSLKPIFSLSDSDTGLSGSSSINEIYEAFKTFVSTYNPKCVYEVTVPIEISLSDIPTLSTIIGNNSFASDTGNIDIKYRCLPIDLI